MPSRNTCVTDRCCVCAGTLPPERPRSDACRQAPGDGATNTYRHRRSCAPPGPANPPPSTNALDARVSVWHMLTAHQPYRGARC